MTQHLLEAVPAQWRPIAKTTTYELVLERIEDQILAGELQVGDRLPPERDLAARLGVSRPAVREALRALNVQGVIRSTVGNSTEAGTVLVNDSRPALTRLIRLHASLGGISAEEVLESRVALERAAAARAAKHVAAADYQELASLLARMSDPELARDGFLALDDAFHAAVARASHGRLAGDLAEAVRAAAEVTGPVGPPVDPIDWQPGAAAAMEELRALYDRIASADAAGAADRMEAHLRGACGRF
jgi:GntR family transcriptional repressor for pyruvate dehydrogenase complex